jgi:hypothetical protein
VVVAVVQTIFQTLLLVVVTVVLVLSSSLTQAHNNSVAV